MSIKPILRDVSQQNRPDTFEAYRRDPPIAELRSADAEMVRVLKTEPLRKASDPSCGVIAYWKHDALHDVVGPMADHVLMTFPAGPKPFERRTGKSVVVGTVRPGTVTLIPAGSSSRWDVPEPLHVVHLYLPHATLERVARDAGRFVCAELRGAAHLRGRHESVCGDDC